MMGGRPRQNQHSDGQQQNPNSQQGHDGSSSNSGFAQVQQANAPAGYVSSSSGSSGNVAAGSSYIQPINREDTRLPAQPLQWPQSSQMAGMIDGENKMFAGTLQQYFQGAQPGPVDVMPPKKSHEEDVRKPSARSTTKLDDLAKSGGFNILDMNLTFPVKLHMILSYPACNEYLRWCDHGRAWIITKPKDFEADVLPKFFRSAKLASFMRQVSALQARVANYVEDLFLKSSSPFLVISRSTDGPSLGSLTVPITTPTGILSSCEDCRIWRTRCDDHQSRNDRLRLREVPQVSLGSSRPTLPSSPRLLRYLRAFPTKSMRVDRLNSLTKPERNKLKARTSIWKMTVISSRK